MTISLQNLSASPAKKKRKRVGRGDASGHGTYAGRGLKGQRSRSGGRKGLTRRGLMATLKGIPKKRGFKSFFAKMAVINLNQLNENFKEGEKVTPEIIWQKKMGKYSQSGLKILGEGKITKKLRVFAHAFSKAAKEAIVKAGGEANQI